MFNGSELCELKIEPIYVLNSLNYGVTFFSIPQKSTESY